MTEKMANLMKGITLKIRTDPYGRVRGLVNKARVMRRIQKAMDELYRWMDAEGHPAEKIRQLLEGLDPLFNPATRARQILKEPTIFFKPSGGTYDLKKKQCYKVLLPSPFGGEPFPVQAWLLLDSYRPEKHRATLKWEKTLDAHRARSILLKGVKDRAKRKGLKVPAEKFLPRFASKEKAQFVYDTEAGFPVSVRYTSTARIQNITIVERLSYTRVAD